MQFGEASGRLLEWLGVLIRELYQAIGPQPFLYGRIIFFGFSLFYLAFAFLPSRYGYGPYRVVRYFHPRRIWTGVFFLALALLLLMVEVRFGEGVNFYVRLTPGDLFSSLSLTGSRSAVL